MLNHFYSFEFREPSNGMGEVGISAMCFQINPQPALQEFARGLGGQRMPLKSKKSDGGGWQTGKPANPACAKATNKISTGFSGDEIKD